MPRPLPSPEMQPDWKRHIVRQLRHRDRKQLSAFRDLVQSYNKLLEKSNFLKDLTENIQTEPLTSPGIHHAARSPSAAPNSPGSGDLLTLQKEIEALKSANGELAFEACELKKRAQEKEDRLKEQKVSMGALSDLVRGHELQRQCLEEVVVRTVCDNMDLKEDYDRLLSQRLWVEGKLQVAELEQRELIEALTKRKAMEAEEQNNQNERRKEEMWMRLVRKALRKTVSADGDLQHCSDSHDSRSLEASGSGESQPRKSRSQSMIAIGSSKLIGAIKSVFDLNFRRDRTEVGYESPWHHPPSICVLCRLPTRALCSKEIHDSEIHAVRFSPNSKMVATGGADRVVKIWDIVGGQLQSHQDLEGSNGGITSIEFDPWGLQVLAASFYGSAHLWKLGCRSSESLTGHKGKVTAAKFKMSVHRAVTCSMDRTIREWDLPKAAWKLFATKDYVEGLLPENYGHIHKLGIRCIPVNSYCSDVVCSDSYLISGHHDKKIRFWDSRSESCFREVMLEEKVTSLCLGQDQVQLLSCSRDDALTLIDLRTANILQVFRPDSSYTLAGSADGTIFIWNVRTGLLEKSLNGEHSAAVNAVAWSVSGDYVVSVDRGRKAVLWSEY